MERLDWLLAGSGAGLVLIGAWPSLVIAGHLDLVGLSWVLVSHGLAPGRLVAAFPTSPDDPPGRVIDAWLAENGRDRGAIVLSRRVFDLDRWPTPAVVCPRGFDEEARLQARSALARSIEATLQPA